MDDDRTGALRFRGKQRRPRFRRQVPCGGQSSAGKLCSATATVRTDEFYAKFSLFEKQFDGSDVDIDEVRPELERIARIERERLLMDQLARQLLFRARVTIYDKELSDNWRRQRLVK